MRSFSWKDNKYENVDDHHTLSAKLVKAKHYEKDRVDSMPEIKMGGGWEWFTKQYVTKKTDTTASVVCLDGEERNFLTMICNSYSGKRALKKKIYNLDDTLFSTYWLTPIIFPGLSSHPEVVAAAVAAIQENGIGCSAAPLIGGTLDLHRQLEEQLAKFVGKEDSLLFSSGYAANLGLFQSILGPNDAVFSDRKNHASIVDAIR